jgi:hypothetical protein
VSDEQRPRYYEMTPAQQLLTLSQRSREHIRALAARFQAKLDAVPEGRPAPVESAGDTRRRRRR